MFIDVGCNHPIEYNNTYLLYLRGWRGMNIDGNGKLIDLYKNQRKGDVSLNYLISNEEKELTFYVSTKDKLSTVSYDEVLKSPDKFKKSDEVKQWTKTLNSLLREHYAPDIEIDLLCIDVEGHEMEVLASIDLQIYRPYLIVVESHDFEIESHANHRLYQLLTSNNYKLTYFMLSTCYFVRNN
jgi:FkbM family methyltransferase